MIREDSVKHKIGFYFFYYLSWPLQKLPLRVLYLFSDLFFLLMFYFPGYRKKIVFENMHNAFPQKTDPEIYRMARSFYAHLCDSFIESFAAISMSEKELRERCAWKNTELLDKYFSEGKSVLSVFGHYGNWEWLSTLPLFTRFRVLALYRPLQNIYFDSYIKSIRQKFGLQTVPVLRSFPVMLEYQKTQIPTITYFLGDQRPIKDHIRYWTRFLNQDTPVMLGTEMIAKKLGQAVVFFSMSKLKRGFYEVEIIPVTDDPRSTGLYEITEKHVRLLENQIHNKPEYWLWSHKRWAHKFEKSI